MFGGVVEVAASVESAVAAGVADVASAAGGSGAAVSGMVRNIKARV